MKSEEENYDFIVGFTIFMKSEYKTMHRHFSSLERAQRFANNVNIKDNHKIYVDYDLYQKEKEKNKELEEENTRQHELLGNIHQNYRGKIAKIQEQNKEIVDTQYISKDKIRKCIQTPYPEVAIENIVELLEENNGKQM